MNDDKKASAEKAKQAEYEAARKRAGVKASERKKQIAGANDAEDEAKKIAKANRKAAQLAKLMEEAVASAKYLPKLLCIGGHNEGETLGGFEMGDKDRIKTVDVYDDTSRKWDTIRTPKCKRYMCGAIILKFPPVPDPDDEEEDEFSGSESDSDEEMRLPKPDINKIVVIGGQKDITRYGEGYDPETNKWEPLPNRPPEFYHTKRWGCAVVNWNGRAVVLGGNTNPHKILDSVELFDPMLPPEQEFKRWQLMPPMSVPRTNACAVCLDGRLIVLGGHDENGRLRSVEWYEPLVSVKSDGESYQEN